MTTTTSGTTVAKPHDLLGLVGRTLGTSVWREITQSDVDQFAKATGDEQWIHVDVERAKSGPFGGTIAHGYLTLSLIAPLFDNLLTVENLGMGVNYGLNKTRFPAPVPVGSRVRLTAAVNAADEIKGGVQIVVSITIERDGGDKPVCIAEAVLRYYD
ncbi:dehydratase [Rhodococcus sp. 06-412-2C]|uniref:MaoC family dehydratase n=1 Tax=unclassified Rhodococcus (in: high G+C Gram-positive bacteria) TaxID=192944 RepID=UPI000B9C0D28|nr:MULTISPECIES: MaoC family dehydratase [unclassified Rhodococcus (in: high G+C Gram-positive bacteria)]OZC83931.1 dehydratase [Rhodococcus sp. 06-412-2C]OZC94119.1 dehydratase [Rhodococcus sp. 06-412-2B]